MLSSDQNVSIPSDRFPSDDGIDHRRSQIIQELGLLTSESVPIFDEATQTAAHFLKATICVLGITDRDRQWFRSAVGLSRIGLMNDLALSRQIPRDASFCSQVVERVQVLSIEDTTTQPEFQNTILARQYGIRAYLGVPLLTSNRDCVGALAIMDLSPRRFTDQEIAFLEIIARWCMSEFERNRLVRDRSSADSPRLNDVSNLVASVSPTTAKSTIQPASAIPILKASLVAQMAQELTTPLTSIIGMTSVLTREIYGPLTPKQKEYMGIVHHSSQYMHALVNEIAELGDLKEQSKELDVSSVDVEMLCQQSLATLEHASRRREQTIRLTVEPKLRLWLLDKNKVRQMLYHLVFRVIQSSNPGSTIRVHVSRKEGQLNLSIWTSHPWLGEGLPQAEVYTSRSALSQTLPIEDDVFLSMTRDCNSVGHEWPMPSESFTAQDYVPASLGTHSGASLGDRPDNPSANHNQLSEDKRLNLGLLLSRQLAELQGGSISLQGSLESGYRYVVTLPQINAATEPREIA